MITAIDHFSVSKILFCTNTVEDVVIQMTLQNFQVFLREFCAHVTMQIQWAL